MGPTTHWVAQHTVMVFVLIVLVRAVTSWFPRRPALQHALWLVVLVKFLVPPIVQWQVPLADWIPALARLERALAIEYASANSLPSTANKSDVHANTASADATFPALEHTEVEIPRSQGAQNEQIGPQSNAQTRERQLDRARHVGGEFHSTITIHQWPHTVRVDPQSDEVVGEGLRGGDSTASELDERWLAGASMLVPPSGVQASDSDAPAVSPSDSGANALSRLPWFDVLPSRHTWLALVWASGSIVLLLVTIVRLVSFRRRLTRDAVESQATQDAVDRMCEQFGIRPIRVVVNSCVSSPCVWCSLRPWLIWPAAISDEATLRTYQGVIGHELAHVKRRDHWVVWLELLATACWWWNPAVWYVRRKLRETADLACDAQALVALPHVDRRRYAEIFLELSAAVVRRGTPAPALGVSTGARRRIERRIRMILNESASCKLSSVGAAGAVLLAAAFLPAWSLATAQDTAAPAAEAATDREPSPETEAARAADDQARPSDEEVLLDQELLADTLELDVEHEILAGPQGEQPGDRPSGLRRIERDEVITTGPDEPDRRARIRRRIVIGDPETRDAPSPARASRDVVRTRPEEPLSIEQRLERLESLVERLLLPQEPRFRREMRNSFLVDEDDENVDREGDRAMQRRLILEQKRAIAEQIERLQSQLETLDRHLERLNRDAPRR